MVEEHTEGWGNQSSSVEELKLRNARYQALEKFLAE